MYKILKNDLRRTFFAWRFVVAVAGVVAAVIATRMQMAYIYDVLYTTVYIRGNPCPKYDFNDLCILCLSKCKYVA